jgi:hypothetical protein
MGDGLTVRGSIAFAELLARPDDCGTARVGKQYSVHLQTVGGKAPIHWGIASGKLPDGCKLDAGNGTITGTPTKKGRYTPVVKATDSEHPPKSAQLPFPITVA